MRYWLLCAGLCGCFHSDAVQCGDTICPPDTTCGRDQRCISDAQLAACAMIADGAACTLAGAPGTCMNGACELAFCGNGVREGLEDCDGDDLGPYDCTDAKPFVTFYDRPGLKCSPTCTYDFTSCTGYCGDGIVNGPEICDSSPPPGTCQDFGFDVGALTCVPQLCAPDTSACGYLGWTRMPLASSASLAGVWASNPRDVYVVGGDGSIGVAFHYDGKTWTQLPLGASTTLTSVTGTSRDDVFVGQSNGKVAHWDGASWTMGTGLDTIPVLGLRAIDATHVFAVGFVGAIAIWNGASWTTMTSGTSGNLPAVWGTDPADVWVPVQSGSGGSAPPILHYDGSQWTTISNDNAPLGATLRGVSGLAGNVYFTVYGPGTSGGLLRWDGAAFSYTPYTFAAASEFGAGAGRGDVFVAQLNAMAAVTPDGTSLTRVAVPSNSLLSAVGSDAMGHLWAVGSGGIVLRHRGTTWQATSQNPFTTTPTYVWGTDATHVFGVANTSSGTECLVYQGSATWSANACGSAALAGVWGTAATNVYAVGSAGTILQSTDGAGATWSAIASPTSQSLLAIWGSDAANIYAVGALGTVLHSNGATWAPIAVPVVDDLAGIWGSDDSHVFVVGAHGRLLRYDGSQWTAETIAAGADLFAVWGASPDDVWAVGAGGVISHFDGAAWSDGAAPMPLNLRAVWGTARGDVFAAGDSGTVLHFDGNRWSPVRIQDVFGIGVGASINSIWGDGRYVFFGGQHELLDRQAFPPAGCASHETQCNDAIDDDCDFLVDCDDPDCRGDAACL